MKDGKWIGVLTVGAGLLGLSVFFIFGGSTGAKDSADQTPVELTPAEEYQESVEFFTNGLIAKEAVRAFDAEAVSGMGVKLCEWLANGDQPSEIEIVMTDFFRSNGHDAKVSENLANGFIRASTQPGECDD